MASYRTRFPRADLMLLEPDRHDEAMFFVNVFRYRERQRLVDHAYQHTRADLRRHAAALGPVLDRHGLALRSAVLRDDRRTFATAIRESARGAARDARSGGRAGAAQDGADGRATGQATPRCACRIVTMAARGWLMALLAAVWLRRE